MGGSVLRLEQDVRRVPALRRHPAVIVDLRSAVPDPEHVRSGRTIEADEIVASPKERLLAGALLLASAFVGLQVVTLAVRAITG